MSSISSIAAFLRPRDAADEARAAILIHLSVCFCADRTVRLHRRCLCELVSETRKFRAMRGIPWTEGRSRKGGSFMAMA
jgi:hypothetical protein